MAQNKTSYVCSVYHVNAQFVRKCLLCILDYIIGDTILAPNLAAVFCVTSRLMYNACRVNTCFYRGLSVYNYPWKHLSQVRSREPSHHLSSKRYVWYWFETKCHNTMAVVLTGGFTRDCHVDDTYSNRQITNQNTQFLNHSCPEMCNRYWRKTKFCSSNAWSQKKSSCGINMVRFFCVATSHYYRAHLRCFPHCPFILWFALPQRFGKNTISIIKRQQLC